MAVAAALQLLAAQRVRPRVGIPTLPAQPGPAVLAEGMAVPVQAVRRAVLLHFRVLLRVVVVVVAVPIKGVLFPVPARAAKSASLTLREFSCCTQLSP
jgi:hypothetical protein